jgi:hypothetical protein
MRECRRELASRGSTTVREAMAGAQGPAGEVEPWRRYPDGEAYDPVSHAQYFFHHHELAAPPPTAMSGDDKPREGLVEAGHFHLFLRAEGMPRGVAPLYFPEQVVANAPTPPQAAPMRRGGGDRVAHLVAVAVDAAGEPVRLFTTNRWVTGETWYRAADVARMLERFAPAATGASPLLDRWLGALLRLFRADIHRLLERRDEAVAKWRWQWPRRGNPLEDQRLEVTSHCTIDLDARLRDGTGPGARLSAISRRPPALPNMCEGWGA